MYDIKDFTPRLYQETIFHTAKMKNTLIVIPTGMGKTKLAILTAVERLKTHPESKIIFLTPTKPLASQICTEFKENTTIEDDKIVLFTGTISPEEREKKSKEATVIVSTPQTCANDIVNRRLDLSDVSCLVVDEAHMAVGNYDYCFVSKQYNKLARYPRIIGLTASPGSKLSEIMEVCKNLHIEEVEVRTHDDPDVKPYIQEMDIEYVQINLPKGFLEIKNFLSDCLKSKLARLKEFGYVNSNTNISKGELLGIQKDLQKRVLGGEKDYTIWTALSVLAEAIKVHHASGLLESQSLAALMKYFNKVFTEAEKGKTKATKNLAIDLNFKSAFVKAKTLFEENIEHPKLERLGDIIKDKIKDKPDSKFIVFTQFRDSASKIVEELQKQDVNAKIFVGQLKKGNTGMSQKEQIEVLEEFRDGMYTALIMTSVGELGLDIPSVDCVIFYEPIPSAIRSIQRRGRTARHDKGEVKVLVTKNTIDEAYRWTAHHKEKRMYRTIADLKDKLKLTRTKQPTLQDFSKEEKIRIYADSREQASGIVRELADKGVDISCKNLLVGDFILGSGEIGVERKEVKDFVSSIIDKRLLQQVKDLKRNFDKPLVIIEGVEDLYAVRKIHPNAIRGMLSTIAISYGIPILYTKNIQDTAELLMTIGKRALNNGKKDIGVRLDKKPLTTKEQQEFIVESLPGVGPSLAKSLLQKFRTVKEVINAKEEHLKEVEKLGDKKAGEIRGIVHEVYPNEEF